MDKAIATALFAVFATATAAQGVYHQGVADCGQWTSARQMGTAGYYEASVTAYANGAAQASGIEVWHGKGVNTSEQAAYMFIDNYCKARPLDSIWTAAWAFVNEKTNNALLKARMKSAK